MMLGLEADRNVSEESFVKERQRDAELGDSVALTFCLPNGEHLVKQFRGGHSIQYVKAVLHHDHNLPMSMVLLCNNRRLIDPLSISDCPVVLRGQDNLITIQV